jgi:LacI family transcriptional regulator
MATTINDVAKAANVSKATVSRYLNDKSLVRRETAEVITTVIRELNYVPSASARNLALRRADTLGVLISGIATPFWNGIVEPFHDSISQQAMHYEIFTLNCDSMILHNTDKTVLDKIRVLVEQRVAGILVTLKDMQEHDIEYLHNTGVPFVVVQGNLEDDRVSCVNIDNYTASYEATQYLLRLGHKSIGYISGPVDSGFANERFRGYRDAMTAGKLYRRGMMLYGNNQYSDGYWRAKQILSWEPVPTAIMTCCDAMAFGAIRAIREEGLSVPNDISVLCFDGLRSQLVMMDLLPPLTSVRQPLEQIGRKSAELLLRKIRDKTMGRDKPYRTLLPTTFVDEGSCAPPRE